MKKIVALLVVAGVAALVLTSLSGAATRMSGSWKSTLTWGAEVPKPTVKAPKAKGSFTATLAGSKLKWKLTYSGLTGKANAAHIHMGAKGKAGNVIVPLCGASPVCKSGLSGTATLSKQDLSWLKKGQLYVNVAHRQEPERRDPRPARGRLDKASAGVRRGAPDRVPLARPDGTRLSSGAHRLQRARVRRGGADGPISRARRGGGAWW